MLSFAAISVREDITRCSPSAFRQVALGYSSQNNGQLIQKIKFKKKITYKLWTKPQWYLLPGYFWNRKCFPAIEIYKPQGTLCVWCTFGTMRGGTAPRVPHCCGEAGSTHQGSFVILKTPQECQLLKEGAWNTHTYNLSRVNLITARRGLSLQEWCRCCKKQRHLFFSSWSCKKKSNSTPINWTQPYTCWTRRAFQQYRCSVP